MRRRWDIRHVNDAIKLKGGSSFKVKLICTDLLRKHIYFLADYENVDYAGLERTEFLEEVGNNFFFYSDKCEKIMSYRMKGIEQSGCTFERCKLKNVRKNGLDFYIAS